ncbi:hypothetical protein FA13DRAFT_1017800 [Coprinellus micaceus]|uniref:Uncharacterized protein n=1 Tax=Coprinellus micaceus TaxID=71717 RepID=A0A4Y7RNR6_COPMI|nr:hypothetical protein FA13DRAFT_1017800 [Coprinellus micaceus]
MRMSYPRHNTRNRKRDALIVRGSSLGPPGTYEAPHSSGLLRPKTFRHTQCVRLIWDRRPSGKVWAGSASTSGRPSFCPRVFQPICGQ